MERFNYREAGPKNGRAELYYLRQAFHFIHIEFFDFEPVARSYHAWHGLLFGIIKIAQASKNMIRVKLNPNIFSWEFRDERVDWFEFLGDKKQIDEILYGSSLENRHYFHQGDIKYRSHVEAIPFNQGLQQPVRIFK